MPRILLLAAALCALSTSISRPTLAEAPDYAEQQEADQPDFILQRIAGPFENPWSIAFLPEGGVLLTERPGRLRFIDEWSGNVREIAGLPEMLTGSHAGLLDIALDPDFRENRVVYLSFTSGAPEAASVNVFKAKLDIDNLILTDGKIIFTSQPPAPGLEQFRGRIAIDWSGYLYLILGDRFSSERAQDLSDHAGSIVRITRDSDAPEDNPFHNIQVGRPEIWTFGHRNPQGLASRK